MTTQSDFQTRDRSADGRKFFTVAEANRSLPYVRRVVADIQSAYQRAVQLQQRMDHPLLGDEPIELNRAYEQSVEVLNRCVEELHATGVELKDYELGLADFPAMVDGREVCLCWKAGETEVRAWHETDAGYSGRKDIGTFGDE